MSTQWITAVLVPLLIVGIPQLISWLNKKVDTDQSRITSLGEQVTRLQARIDAQDSKIIGLQNTLNRFLSRDTLWRIHVDRQDAEMIKAGLEPLPRNPALDVEAASLHDDD